MVRGRLERSVSGRDSESSFRLDEDDGKAADGGVGEELLEAGGDGGSCGGSGASRVPKI